MSEETPWYQDEEKLYAEIRNMHHDEQRQTRPEKDQPSIESVAIGVIKALTPKESTQPDVNSARIHSPTQPTIIILRGKNEYITSYFPETQGSYEQAIAEVRNVAKQKSITPFERLGCIEKIVNIKKQHEKIFRK